MMDLRTRRNVHENCTRAVRDHDMPHVPLSYFGASDRELMEPKTDDAFLDFLVGVAEAAQRKWLVALTAEYGPTLPGFRMEKGRFVRT